jgi:hypothetical protein
MRPTAALSRRPHPRAVRRGLAATLLAMDDDPLLLCDCGPGQLCDGTAQDAREAGSSA